MRTAKSRRIGKRPSAFVSVSEELLLFLALIACIVGMINSTGINYIEGRLWIAILAAQAIPYGSALIGAWVAHRAGDAVG